MPLRACFAYLVSKYKNTLKQEMLEKQNKELFELKIKHDNYIADCLWALATERRFKDKQDNPKYPRWHEVAFPKKKEKLPTGSDIMQELITAW